MDASRSILTPRYVFRGAGALAAAAALAFLVGLGPAAALPGGTWSQAQGDAAKTGVAASGPSVPYRVAWTAKGALGGPDGHYGDSAPALTSDEAIVVGPTQVDGYSLTDGSQVFSVNRDYGPSVSAAVGSLSDGRQAVVYTEGFGDNPPTASGTPRPTPTSATPTPTGTGGSGTTPALDSHVAAFDLATRRPLWDPIQLDEVSRTGVTVSGTTAYLGDTHGNVYAIDLERGAILWKVDVGGTLITSVATAGDRVVVCSQGSRTGKSSILGLSTQDGSTVWRNESPSFGAILSSPSIGGDAVYVGYNDATLHAYDLEQGTERWSARLATPMNFTTGPAVTEDAVYAVDLFGELYRFDPATGARVWDFALNEGVYRSGPVIVGGTALIATVQGRLAGIDTATGHLIFDSGAPGAPLRTLAVGADSIVGIRGGRRAGVVAFEHDPSGALIDVVSPTEVNPSRMGVNFAIAAVVFVAVLLLAGHFIAPRMGPAFILEDDAEPGADDAVDRDDGTDGGDDA